MWQDKPINLAVASHPIFWAKTAQSHPRLLKNSAPRKSAIDARALLYPPTLRRRTLSRLPPHAAGARTPASMPPVPEPGCRSLGHVPLPPCGPALLGHRLPAHLQRPHPSPAPPEQAVRCVLDAGPLPVVSVVVVATPGPGGGGPEPDALPLGRVAAASGRVVRNRAPLGGPGEAEAL